MALAACLLLLLASCTSERAYYLPERRVVCEPSRLSTEPQIDSATFWFYRETFYFLPDAATATGFAIEVDPTALSSGAVLRIGEPGVRAEAICLFAPSYTAFDVSGTLEAVDVAKDSIRARVRLHREGLPTTLFPSGTWSFEQEIEFELREVGEEEDIPVSEWL